LCPPELGTFDRSDDFPHPVSSRATMNVISQRRRCVKFTSMYSFQVHVRLYQLPEHIVAVVARMDLSWKWLYGFNVCNQ